MIKNTRQADSGFLTKNIIPKFVPIKINKISQILVEMLVVCIATSIHCPQFRTVLGQWDCKIAVSFG